MLYELKLPPCQGLKTIKCGVTQSLLECATHSTYTWCRGRDSNAYVTMQEIAVANQWSSRRFIHPRQVWHQFIDPVEMEGLIGLCGKSERGTWPRVRATTGTSTDYATRTPLSYKCAFCSQSIEVKKSIKLNFDFGKNNSRIQLCSSFTCSTSTTPEFAQEPWWDALFRGWCVK